jgi:peptidoglycan/LPS O-acetylase OafA/YrhL
MDAAREAGADSLRASPLFTLALLLTLMAAGFNGVMVFLMMLDVDLPGAFARMTHFQEPHHRIHDLTFGFLFIPALVGIFAQLRRPAENVAGQLMALIPTVSLLVVLLATALAGDTRVLQPPWVTVGAAALIALGLHPAGHDFFGSFRVSRANRVMVALVVVAAVPLLLLAASNIELQVSVADDHAAAGHYGFMAAFGLAVGGVGLLASLRPDGWRLTAWVAGLLPALLGFVSLVYPISSSLTLPWALAAIAWGVAFVVTAERVRHGERPASFEARV